MKTHHLLVVFCLFLVACSSNSSLTSSFANRKYTKGVFWDSPGKVDDNTKVKTEVKDKIEENTQVEIKAKTEGNAKIEKQVSIAPNNIMLTKSNTLITKTKLINNQLVNIVNKCYLPNIDSTKTSAPKSDPKEPKPATKWLIGGFFLVALGILILSILGALTPGVLVLLSVLGLGLLVTGIRINEPVHNESNTVTGTQPSQNNPSNQVDKRSNGGTTSLVLAIMGFVITLFGGFFAFIAVFTGVLGLSAVLLAIPLIISAIALIIGDKAACKTKEQERHPGEGKAGTIIAMLNIIILLIIAYAIFAPFIM